MENTTIAIELLLLAIAMAVVTKYIRLPYTTALVICGLAVGITHFLPIRIERDLILMVFLPPLLFEGALNMDLDLLKEQWLPVLLYALVGTVLGAAIIGGLLWLLTPLPFLYALFLGTILSATDPVSVLAMFKQYGVEKRLAIVLEGESVFNDGIAVVLYLVMYGIVKEGGHVPTAGQALGEAGLIAGGGAAVGLVVGWVAYRALKRIDDHLLEVMISVVLAWGAYLLAERFHMSGVLATACAGLIIGNFGRYFAMSPTTRVTLNSFWEVAAFIANSFVFILIGVQIEGASFARHGWAMVAAVLAVVVSRGAVVYGLAPVLRLGGWRFPLSWQHVMNVGGLRGSIPIALVLGLPAAMADRELFLTAVFGVVFFSLVVQGLAIKPLLSRLGLIGLDARQLEFETKLGRAMSLKSALRELKELAEDGEVSPPLFERISREIQKEKEDISREIGVLQEQHDFLRDGEERRVMRRLLHARRSAVEDVFRRGVISEPALDEIRREIDALAADLSEGGPRPSGRSEGSETGDRA